MGLRTRSGVRPRIPRLLELETAAPRATPHWPPTPLGRLRHPVCMDISEAAERYLRYVADVRRLSPATVRAYRSDLADLAGRDRVALVVDDPQLHPGNASTYRSRFGHEHRGVERRESRGRLGLAVHDEYVRLVRSGQQLAQKRRRQSPTGLLNDAQMWQRAMYERTVAQ
mgnify:CR=1 FL=1